MYKKIVFIHQAQIYLMKIQSSLYNQAVLSVFVP